MSCDTIDGVIMIYLKDWFGFGCSLNLLLSALFNWLYILSALRVCSVLVVFGLGLLNLGKSN